MRHLLHTDPLSRLAQQTRGVGVDVVQQVQRTVGIAGDRRQRPRSVRRRSPVLDLVAGTRLGLFLEAADDRGGDRGDDVRLR